MVKYNEVMSRLEVDDDMRERVLAQVEGAQGTAPAPRFKASRAKRYLVPAACAALLVAGVLAVPAVMPAPESALESVQPTTSSSAAGEREAEAGTLDGRTKPGSASSGEGADSRQGASLSGADAAGSSSASAQGDAASNAASGLDSSQSSDSAQAADGEQVQSADAGNGLVSVPQEEGGTADQLASEPAAPQQAPGVATEDRIEDIVDIQTVNGEGSLSMFDANEYSSSEQRAAPLATSKSSAEAGSKSSGESAPRGRVQSSESSNAGAAAPDDTVTGTKTRESGGSNGESGDHGSESSMASVDDAGETATVKDSDEPAPQPNVPVTGPDAREGEVASAVELSSTTGVAVADIPSLASKADRVTYRSLGQGRAEIEYTLSGQVTRYRIGGEGVEGSFPTVRKGEAGGVTVTYFGDDDGFRAASWSVDGVSYTLELSEPAKKAVVAGYAAEAIGAL